MRVWLYRRLSNDDDKEQNSLLNQRKILLEYATRQGYAIVGESADDNASGMNFRRDGVAQIIKAAEARQIDAVLVKDLSRLGRHKTQTALFIDFLREHNIRVISVTEGIDTFNENDDLLVGVRGLINDHYAKDIGKKIRSGYRQKQKDGIVIIAPFGYWKNKNTRQVEILDEAADTVRLIFSLYLAGTPLRGIAQTLNVQGHKTPAQMQTELYGKQWVKAPLWTYNTVKRILSDESYAGTLCNHKRETVEGISGPCLPRSEQIRHEDYYPAIISKEDWLAVQAELACRNGKKVPQGNNRVKHRYAGLLKCGDCGAPFIAQNRYWNGKCRVEYVCKNYLLHGKSVCTSHRIHEEVLDAAVVREITVLRDRLLVQAEAKKREQKKWASGRYLLDAQIAALQEKIQSLDADIEALLMERIQDKANVARYDTLIANLSSEQTAACQELGDLQSRNTSLRCEIKTIAKLVAKLGAVLEHTPIEEELIRQSVIQIVLTLAEKEVSVSIKCKSAD